jgi:cytoskeletal protein CcmA (bactofilin family)
VGGGLNKRWLTIIGLAALVAMPAFSIALTPQYADCRNSLAVTYSDDLNPTAIEEITTFISCERQILNSNIRLLEELLALTASIVVFCLFIYRISSSHPRPHQTMQLPSKLNLDRHQFSTFGPRLDKTKADEIAPSIIGSTVTMEGALRSAGNLQIEGNINGNVRCSSLLITASGKVCGEIFAERILIQGKVQGTIHANEVILSSGCRVDGTIWQKSLQVEIGARFTGDCRRSEAPFVNLEKRGGIEPLSSPAAVARSIEDVG